MHKIGLFPLFAAAGVIGCQSAPTSSATSRDAVIARIDWNSPVQEAVNVRQPVQVSVHFAVSMTFLTLSSGRNLYSSPWFQDGKTTTHSERDDVVFCYALGSREGTVRGTGPYEVVGTHARTNVFSTFSSAWATVSFSRNDEGLKGISCSKRTRGQNANLNITWDEVRRSVWSATGGAYFALEDAPIDNEVSPAATPEELAADAEAVAQLEAGAAEATAAPAP